MFVNLGNLAKLLKLIQETSQSTSERYGRNLAMLGNIKTRGFNDLPELLATQVTSGYAPNFSDDEASCRNNAWNCTRRSHLNFTIRM